MVLNLLQRMVFPILNREQMIDSIIKKCWHGKYKSITKLAKDTEKLLRSSDEFLDPKNRESRDSDSNSADLSSKQKLCEDIVASGLLSWLSSDDPRQLGFSMNRRHVCWELLK